MALDKVSAAMMSPQSVGESAPSNPTVGQRWYRASTAVTYQYTNDGTSSFWLDVSSAGIGTSARGIDFVGDIDPHSTTNGTGLAVGSVYYNREKNRHFVCTDATTNANVWSGRYSGIGGTETFAQASSVWYRFHTFTTTGESTFSLDSTTTCNILCVGGGGGGGYWGGCGGGGGSVYQRTDFSLAAGVYTVIVGAGGGSRYGTGGGHEASGVNGGNSKLGTAHIGFGGGGGGSAGTHGLNGGCGGGRDDDGSNTNPGTGLTGLSAGVSLNGDTITADHKTYSFSTTPTQGSNSSHNGSGGGGAGGLNGTWDGTDTMASPGHAGHGGIGKLITWATHEGSSADNTDGGGGYFAGGGHGLSSNTLATVPGGAAVTAHPNSGAGGNGDKKTNGGSGIVIIRYAL